MEPRREKLSDLLHGSALPPPPTKRAVVFSAIAAMLGTLACSLAAYRHELRVAYVAPAIGAMVGLGMLRARGYGQRLSVAAVGLTLLAIAATYYLTFVLVVVSRTEASRLVLQKDAEVWRQLQNPTDDQVFAFAEQQGFAFTTRTAFEHYPGKLLDWLAAAPRTLSEWRWWEFENSSFAEYLRATTGALDYALAGVALAIAFLMVRLRTAKLEDRAKQKAIARRQQEARSATEQN
jgi:hypothetical protein